MSCQHSVTGSARLPGSKYSITEAEINDTRTRTELEALMEDARARNRPGCCGRPGLLQKWHYIDSFGEEFQLGLRETTKYTEHEYNEKLTSMQVMLDPPHCDQRCPARHSNHAVPPRSAAVRWRRWATGSSCRG